MKKYILLLTLAACVGTLFAKPVLLSTKSTSMLLDAEEGKALQFCYYGTKLSEAEATQLFEAGLLLNRAAYPSFGANMTQMVAMEVSHSDGNPTLDLVVRSVETSHQDGTDVTCITLRDTYYPFEMKVFYRIIPDSDVIEQWTEIQHQEKGRVQLHRFDSAYMPIRRGDVWVSDFYGGSWGSEGMLTVEPLPNGIKSISSFEGGRSGALSQAQVMFSLDGEPQENRGRVIGAALAWGGNFEMRINTASSNMHDFFAGISNLGSAYVLEAKEVFDTPKVIWTYSERGLGGASRNYHRWARAGGMHGGNQLRDILLNSWEGLRFDITEEKMHQMMDDIADLGGELFVMDDGWFGGKYQRNTGSTTLGDWVTDTRKLPNGVPGLVSKANSAGIKFGIWIEPEAVNSQSELFEKHPEWALQAKHRDFHYGRGGTQLLLDLTNPAVQDHVFNIVDRLMTENPQLAYFKWDANVSLNNYGSTYLPVDKQQNLYIDYQRGLLKVLQRIRAKYPNVVMQACGGGGARINYGVLPYFDEFWVSDNTDALQRIYLQWARSYFYPVMSLAQHVSEMPNQTTHRTVPFKFSFDVAMTGRLGMELIPAELSPEELAFSKKNIADYKRIRPVVQLGEQYRLLSPHSDTGFSSMMFVDEAKNRAVFFAFKLEHYNNQPTLRFLMDGLKPDSDYLIHELSVPDGVSPIALDGKVLSGKILMETGIELDMGNEYQSRVLELICYEK